jgi:hypothetical protein
VQHLHWAATMASTISKTASTVSAGSGSTKSTGRMSPCKYCRGEVEFCERCKRRFRESVSEEKCERIAFGSEREDFERMKKDLEALVDKKETVILSHEQFPGSTQTPHQRRRTLRLAKKGMDEHEIKLAVEEQKRNKEDLPGLELEVMPTAAYNQLANIHDGTRSWLHKHEKRIEGHNKWLKQNAVDRQSHAPQEDEGQKKGHRLRRRAEARRSSGAGVSAGGAVSKVLAKSGTCPGVDGLRLHNAAATAYGWRGESGTPSTRR